MPMAKQQQPAPDLIGRHFGDLEVLAFVGVRDGRRWWRCKCLSTERTGSVCGQLRTVQTGTLNRTGGRRCRECNQYVLRQHSQQTSAWIYR